MSGKGKGSNMHIYMHYTALKRRKSYLCANIKGSGRYYAKRNKTDT